MTNRNPPPYQDYRPSRDARPPRLPADARGPRRRPPQRGSARRQSGGFGATLVYVLVGIAVIVAAALAFLVVAPPTGLIRDQIVARVKEKTGRDLVIAGPASFTILPSPGVSLSSVSLGAPPEMAGEPLVTMDRLDVRLALTPLLSGKVVVEALTLTNPVFDLRVDASGRKSWQFARHADGSSAFVRLAQAATGTASDAPSLVPDSARQFLTDAPQAAASNRSGSASRLARVSDIELGEVRIDNGAFRFADERRGTLEQVDQVNVALALKSVADPLETRGDLVWRGEKIKVTATLTSLEGLLRNEPTKLVTTLESAPMAAGYDGTLAFDDALALDGALIVDSKSLRNLSAWLGTPLPQSEGFGALSLESRLVVAGNSVSLVNAKSTLDGSRATGDVTVTKAPGRPYVKANLKLAELDLNKYVGSPGPRAPAVTSAPAAPGPAKAPPQSIDDLLQEPAPRVKGYTARKGWSSEPIDLTLLAAADADVTVSADRLLFKGIRAGRSRLAVAVKDAAMRADLEEVSLYRGTARGVVTVNAAAPAPAFAANIVVDGVSAQPLLKDAADFDWLTGTGTLSLALSSAGGSEREIIEALGGTADFRFVDGAVAGFNVAEAIRGLGKGNLEGLNRTPTEKTDFSDLSATFKIANGIAQSDDLKMASPLLRLTGAGQVRLPQRQVDFTVRPKLVADLAGQGGETALDGIEIPVRIHGTFDKLNYTPEVGDILKDPEKTAEAVKKIGEKLKGKSAQELIDGVVTEDASGKKKVDTKKLLNNLFGR